MHSSVHFRHHNTGAKFEKFLTVICKGIPNFVNFIFLYCDSMMHSSMYFRHHNTGAKFENFLTVICKDIPNFVNFILVYVSKHLFHLF